MSTLEELYYCLDVEVISNRESKITKLSKSKYIKEILNQLNIKDYEPI